MYLAQRMETIGDMSRDKCIYGDRPESMASAAFVNSLFWPPIPDACVPDRTDAVVLWQWSRLTSFPETKVSEKFLFSVLFVWF